MIELDEIKTEYGRTFFVPKKDSFMMKRMIKHNYFQSSNLRYIKRLLNNKARIIIDVGANIGMNTIEYSQICKQVYSFEPSDINFILLEKNLTVNNTDKEKVMLYKIALGNNQCKIQFNENIKQGGLSSIKYNDDVLKNTITIDVEVKKLDDYNIVDVDFIKIDVEGYEKEVLLGSIKTLKRERPIVQVETNPKYTKHYNYDLDDIYEIFRELGNYVCATNDGKFVSMTNHIENRKTDRFFIPLERINNKLSVI